MINNQTILITGAHGRIGKKLQRHFSTLCRDVRLVDRKNDEDSPVTHVADLSEYNESWGRQFSNVDTVIHLAADPRQDAAWSSIYPDNVVATQNVVLAARRHNVGRIVFASSNWVLAGYRFAEPDQLNGQLPPKPVNPYGVSKFTGEQIGAAVSHDISFIALRIGASITDFTSMSNFAPWFQQMWVSDRDLCQAMQGAVAARADLKYAVLNVMSNNRRKPDLKMRWDIEETKSAIGYAPQDGETVIETPPALEQETIAQKNYAKLNYFSAVCSIV